MGTIYDQAPSPDRVASYREKFRADNIGPGYRGWAHLAFTSVGAIAAIAFAASWLDNVHGLQWLTVPVGFLIANAAEYFGHRGPMHRPKPGMRILYQRHTLEHHHFFTHDAMVFESARDFKITLFPPVMLVFFLGCLAAPIAGVLYLAFGANVGWLFAVVAVSYFLSYEWLHFCYHLSPNCLVGRLWLVRVLRQHHTAHHNLALMGSKNFNITFPICDLVFGTMARADAKPADAKPADAKPADAKPDRHEA